MRILSLWSLVAEPDLMNLWSPARVTSVALGDGGHPAGIGAVRTVRLPIRPAFLLEEIIEDSDPPDRLVYRVFRGAPIRRHRGEIRIEPDAAEPIRWTFELDALPGIEPIARRLLVPYLTAGLARLPTLARSVSPLPPPPRRTIDADVALAPLADRARACGAEQRRVADELLEHGDPRGWFARVYQYVTEAQIEAALGGTLVHAAWVLRLVPPFHRLYLDNLTRRLGRTDGEVEAHWRRAFIATERTRARAGATPRPPFEAAMVAIYTGMRAHIEHDLPRALAEVYVHHYADACDYARFRADYYRMAELFVHAGDRLLADLPRASWPVRARLLDRLTPRDLRHFMLNRRFYPIAQRRREAFERGGAIARTWLGR